MVDGILDCIQLANRSLDIFRPIYDEWRKQDHREQSLAAAVEGMSAAKVLEKDMRDLGVYLIAQDDRSTRIELGVLVDCIAELRSHGGESSGMYAERVVQELEMEKQKNANSGFAPPPVAISLPLCLRVVRDLKRMGKTADAKGLREMLVEFLHRIVVQDGNVMAQEIAAVKDIEEFLTDMTTGD